MLYHDADIQPNVRSVKRWLNKVGGETLEKLIEIRIADINAQSDRNKIPRIDRCYLILEIARDIVLTNQCFQIKDLDINGNDVIDLGVPKGPMVGKVLNHLLDLVIDDKIKNERDVLLEVANGYLKGGLN